MQKRKCDRRNQVIEVLKQIQKISSEMECSSRYTLASTVVDEMDLSLRKLEELQRELQALQKEKVSLFIQLFHFLCCIKVVSVLSALSDVIVFLISVFLCT